MHPRIRPAASVPAHLAAFVAAMAALAPSARSAQADDLRALDGDGLYVEDRIAGRASEEQQPPMSVTFALRVEEDAVVMVRGKGTGRREERIPLDGSTSK